MTSLCLKQQKHMVDENIFLGKVSSLALQTTVHSQTCLGWWNKAILSSSREVRSRVLKHAALAVPLPSTVLSLPIPVNILGVRSEASPRTEFSMFWLHCFLTSIASPLPPFQDGSFFPPWSFVNSRVTVRCLQRYKTRRFLTTKETNYGRTWMSWYYSVYVLLQSVFTQLLSSPLGLAASRTQSLLEMRVLTVLPCYHLGFAHSLAQTFSTYVMSESQVAPLVRLGIKSRRQQKKLLTNLWYLRACYILDLRSEELRLS